MYEEESLLPISALQHLAYCERQCALIHLEDVWDENLLTAEGRILHDRVHDRDREIDIRAGVRYEYSVRIRSLRLGLSGIADVVEFHRGEKKGVWIPFPVEYKHGRPKRSSIDAIQLCAQGMCLEEMTGSTIEKGALFYGKIRRRQDVMFDDSLRELTADTAYKLHRLTGDGVTPPPVNDGRCRNCSLRDACMPTIRGEYSTVEQYIREVIRN